MVLQSSQAAALLASGVGSPSLLSIDRQLGLVRVVEELALEVFGLVRRSSAESEPQEHVRPASLHVLLVEQVQQQVFVPLNQSLRVNLPMLQLLVAVSLNPFQ